MDRWDRMPQGDNQARYLVACVCYSALPMLVILLLPDPWRSSLVPIAVLLGTYACFFASGLVLFAIEKVWQLARPPCKIKLCCPVCNTIEQPYRPFYAAQVAPGILRIHCPECHERWI